MTLGSILREAIGVAVGSARESLRAARPALEASIRTEHEHRATEADANEDEGYRRIGGTSDTPGLTPIAQDRAISLAALLYRSHPYVRRMTHITRDFVVGSGIKVVAQDPGVQAVLDRHWKDPVNRWRSRQRNRTAELGLYGEACWPVVVGRDSGLVRIATVYPGRIKEVIQDPDNAEMVIGVVLWGRTGVTEKRLSTVFPATDEELFAPAAIAERKKMTDGRCFYFAVNQLSDAPRGSPDLLSTFDWLLALDRMHETGITRADVLNMAAWDVSIKNGTDKEVKALAMKLRPPTPGGLNVHSDRVSWEAQTPSLNAADNQAFLDSIKEYILVGEGFPRHWLSEGRDANKATAAMMDTPVMRSLEARQAEVVEFIEQVLAFQILEARRAGVGGLSGVPTEDLAFEVVAPRVTQDAITSIASAFQQIVVALTTALDFGLIQEDAAIAVLRRIFSDLGVREDPTPQSDGVPARQRGQQAGPAAGGVDARAPRAVGNVHPLLRRGG